MQSGLPQIASVPGGSRGTRNARRLVAQMAAAEQQRNLERGQRIRELRERLGSQQDAARVMDIALKTVQNWEYGHEVSRAYRQRLADFLGVSWDYIEWGEAGRAGVPLPGTQLDLIERKLDLIIEALGLVATPSPQQDDRLAEIRRAVEAAGRLRDPQPERRSQERRGRRSEDQAL